MKRAIVCIIGVLCGTVVSVAANEIRVNQVAYYADAVKVAAVPGSESGAFELVDAATGVVVFSAALPDTPKTWRASGDSVKLADFSAYTGEGRFYLKTASARSEAFAVVKKEAYRGLLASVMKSFYFWRVSTDIPERYGNGLGMTGRVANFARAAGHPDTEVRVHNSAASAKRPAGTILKAPKGWYDAGDYNKYVVNAGVSVFFMAHALEAFPAYFKGLDVDIPESGNVVPDLLDELKWEYDWLFAMQDTDGGVYFKLSSLSFNGFEMPEEDRLPRYMVGKSTTSALDFAAMMAMGYRLFKPYETAFPGYSAACLAAAERAWAWAKANPSTAFRNPPDVRTGEYGDGAFADEFFWAAAELFISTGKEAYYRELDFTLGFTAPNWPYVCTNGLMSLALHLESLAPAADRKLIRETYRASVDKLWKEYKNSPYKVAISTFNWGSNGEVASRAAFLMDAYRFLGDSQYREAGMAGLDYLLGRNATGYCFVTGFGAKSPLNIHDRRSGADGIDAPIPGYLAGGPNASAGADSGAGAYPSRSPAKRYLDVESSYSTNEIAINWNAPLLCLVAMVENAMAK